MLSCQNTNDKKPVSENSVEIKETTVSPNTKQAMQVDTIVISQKHKPNFIIGDFDGDKLNDTVRLVQSIRNKKYGLKIIFGNNKVDYFGMGHDILKQGFDDLDWVGIFEKAPKGAVYYNNVNDAGEIITEEQVKEKDKIKLPYDAIFIHQAEACGGGIIYIKNGKFDWIQQE
ncbi:MAG: hypothetical protein EOP00_30100 [Pedobacter sp.]|nr:MAG: hypothetical protein EOP00_30100 [Pedobacter sp.]